MTSSQNAVPRAWLVRGSKDVRFDRWMLENGFTGIDFREIGDLREAADLTRMRALVTRQLPDKKGQYQNT